MAPRTLFVSGLGFEKTLLLSGRLMREEFFIDNRLVRIHLIIEVKLGPLGPLDSSSSQHRRTLELILQEGSAFF